MDQYLYPWYDGDGGPHISTVWARNYDECLEKILSKESRLILILKIAP